MRGRNFDPPSTVAQWPIELRLKANPAVNLIVLGDFNEWMRGLTTTLLSEKLKSADLRTFLRRRRTYPGFFPIMHLDHIYYAGHLEIVRVELPRTRLALVASDHLPLVAEFEV